MITANSHNIKPSPPLVLLHKGFSFPDCSKNSRVEKEYFLLAPKVLDPPLRTGRTEQAVPHSPIFPILALGGMEEEEGGQLLEGFKL